MQQQCAIKTWVGLGSLVPPLFFIYTHVIKNKFICSAFFFQECQSLSRLYLGNLFINLILVRFRHMQAWYNWPFEKYTKDSAAFIIKINPQLFAVVKRQLANCSIHRDTSDSSINRFINSIATFFQIFLIMTNTLFLEL